MPFLIRPHRRFPVLLPRHLSRGLFKATAPSWNLSVNGWRLSGDLPMRLGESLSLTVTRPECAMYRDPSRGGPMVTRSGVCRGNGHG